MTQHLDALQAMLHGTVSLTKSTDYCSNCGRPCEAFPGRWDIDPLCTGCKFTIKAEDTFLELPTPHDFAFALKEPVAAMELSDSLYFAVIDPAHNCNPISWFDPTYY